MTKVWFKKRKALVSVCVLALLVAVGSIALWAYRSSLAIYKRIDINAPAADGELSVWENTVDRGTDTELKAEDAFMKTMSVYEISPRTITEEQFAQLGAFFQMDGEIEPRKTCLYWEWQEHRLWWEENEISYSWSGHVDKAITKSDEEMIALAKEIFEALPIIEGEYECLGIGSVQTVHSKAGSFDVKKRICFRRLVDGVRVIGNDLVDIYVGEDGVTEIYMYFYDYIKTDELPMLSLEEAFEKVKEPDAFALETEETDFSGKAEKLTVEKAKLLYVNQFSDGCTILQPVFNLMGTLENDTGIAEFSAKIIAIPEKYTYTE
ncbi:MAG: hypothetical protein IKK06_03725 [Clostridia bacterium]|nr:hypothetical protein [Clostridia bacterium]